MMPGTMPDAHGGVLFLVGVSVSEFSFSLFKEGSVWRGLELLRRPRVSGDVTNDLGRASFSRGRGHGAAGRQEKDSRRSSRKCRTAVSERCAAPNKHRRKGIPASHLTLLLRLTKFPTYFRAAFYRYTRSTVAMDME